MDPVMYLRRNKGDYMSSITPEHVAYSKVTSAVRANNARVFADHWQVSQYFPVNPAGSAIRWSRASDVSTETADDATGRGMSGAMTPARGTHEGDGPTRAREG